MLQKRATDLIGFCECKDMQRVTALIWQETAAIMYMYMYVTGMLLFQIFLMFPQMFDAVQPLIASLKDPEETPWNLHCKKDCPTCIHKRGEGLQC